MQESGRFPNTRWSLLLAAADEEPERAREAFTALARNYWKPVYAYMRLRWAKTDEEAGDLTQEFFLWMLEHRFLDRADPERGRFRGLIKSALKGFVLNDIRDRARQKRGGGKPMIAVEQVNLEDPRDRPPEEVLDSMWKKEVMKHALERLETEMKKDGKETHFRVFEDYFLRTTSDLDYEDVSRRHGLTTGQVGAHLRTAKRRFRTVMRDVVLETVRDEEELRREWSMLFPEDS